MNLISRTLASAQQRYPGKDKAYIYGVFNVYHIGHQRLFEFAKTKADVLFVGIISDAELTKGVICNETDRMASVLNSGLVDEVFIAPSDQTEIIKLLSPLTLIKGSELRRPNDPERLLVESLGGRVFYSAGNERGLKGAKAYDSTRRLDLNWDALGIYIDHHEISGKETSDILKNMRTQRPVIIGEPILDEYIECDAVGLSREEPVVVMRPVSRKKFIGGAAIVAAHALRCTGNVYLATVMGDDHTAEEIRSRCYQLGEGFKLSSLVEHGRITTLKSRYRIDGRSMMRVNEFTSTELSVNAQENLKKYIYQALTDSSTLIFAEFNYGLLTPELIADVTALAKSSGLICAADSQSSSQSGDIGKFHGMTLITPTETEARLALSDYRSSIRDLAKKLQSATSAKYVVITLGENGVFIHTDKEGNGWESDVLPALNKDPIDVSGAGDAFLIGCTLALGAGADIWRSALIGSLYSAMQVSTEGNQPIDPDSIAELIELVA